MGFSKNSKRVTNYRTPYHLPFKTYLTYKILTARTCFLQTSSEFNTDRYFSFSLPNLIYPSLSLHVLRFYMKNPHIVLKNNPYRIHSYATFSDCKNRSEKKNKKKKHCLSHIVKSVNLVFLLFYLLPFLLLIIFVSLSIGYPRSSIPRFHRVLLFLWVRFSRRFSSSFYFLFHRRSSTPPFSITARLSLHPFSTGESSLHVGRCVFQDPTSPSSAWN